MSGYIGTQPVPQATQTRDAFTCTAGQTSFATSGYTPSFLDVYLNGIKLAAADYTASNGSDVVLASGAALDDILEVVAYTSFEAAHVTGADDFTVTGSFTSQGIDDNASSTAITIDGSQNVGIGVASPAAQLHVNSGAGNLAGLFESSDAGATITLIDNATTGGSVAENGLNTVGDQLEVRAVDNLSFETAGIERMRINSSGALLHGTTTAGSAGAGDIVVNGGVYLGGTGSANKLDDYEEGTWTPVLSDASTGGNLATIANVRAIYTKIGNQVIVHLNLNNISTGGMTGSNDFFIQGLPFTPPSYTSPSMNYMGSVRLNLVAFTGDLTAYVVDNTSYVVVKENLTGAVSNSLRVSAITSGTADISISVTYETT